MYYSQPPQAGSLTTAADLLAWTAGNDPINAASVPLASRGGMPQTTRVLMLGPSPTAGFDSESQGGTSQDIFNFDRWAYIDAMYFSQATFAVPPVVWINACHRNGVLALGGVITYWTPNYADFHTLMAHAATATAAANQLAAMAAYYGFDGYVVDIESFRGATQAPKEGPPDARTIDVGNFQLFLSTLRAGLQASSPNSMLVYYETVDGLTTPGTVDQYYNALCANNQMFFQDGPDTIVSDAMFCNWEWDGQIPSSAALATKLGRSPLDLYMEVLVGTEQGETWKQVRQCVQGNVSTGLFGATWPFTSRSDETSFGSLMDVLWGTGMNPSTGIAAVITPRPVPAALPFCTTFNQGQGRQFYWPLHGTQAYGGSDWNNLSLQDVALTWQAPVSATAGSPDAFALDPSYDLALDGGSSLLLWSGSGATGGAFSVIDLYATAWSLANGLEASYALQPVAGAGADIAIGLVLNDPDQTLLLLASPAVSALQIPGYSVVVVQPSSTTTIQPVSASSTPAPWTLRSYTGLATSCAAYDVVEVLAVAVVTGDGTLPPGTQQLYLGQLVVAESGGLAAAPASVTELAVEAAWMTLPVGAAAVNVELSWTAPTTGTVRAYDVSYTFSGGDQELNQVWLGRTTNTMYYVNQLAFSVLAGQNYPTELQFVVQVMGGNGVEQDVGDAASVPFAWSPPS